MSYETVRRWVLKFGPAIARRLRQRRPRAERSLAFGRDGGAHRRRADVSLACRRPRGRSSRHAPPASTRQSIGAAVNAQAAQEAGLRAENCGHRQAALLRLRVPTSAIDLSGMSRGFAKTIGRRIRIRQCDDASASCSGSSQLDPLSASSACTVQFTTPSTFNATSSPDPPCGSSAPKRLQSGKKRSQRHDVWRALALNAFS